MRVRFAPSPTGSLHIGSVRTALYNWLLAHAPGEQGTLVLRIEDTDPERSTAENVAQILDALRWLNLDWDEGPVMQSQRAERHREVLELLLQQGRAYRCSATAEEVREYKRRHGAERGFRGEPENSGAVRLRLPDDGETAFNDIIRGPISFPNSALDDPVIARADGSALYNFAVAVDDLDARITHVVRGEDHISNTPKQLQVMHALGVTPPLYAHLPLLHGPDGKKLSKRHGAASVQDLRSAGYLPEAVANYLALLGAGFAADEEKFTLPELAERFRLQRVSRNPAVFDERKLRHLNGRYMRELSDAELVRRLTAFTGRDGLEGAVRIARDKIQTLGDFWPLVSFLYEGPAEDPRAWEQLASPPAPRRLAAAREALAALDRFDAEAVEAALRALVDAEGCKPGEVFQPVRIALAGTTVSPGIFETLELLGRDESLRRIEAALRRVGGEG
jgi:glutamyl-tRNA synthetase